MRVASAFLLLAACAADPTTKGPEGDVPTDGKLDSFQAPTDHGAIAFGAAQTGKLSSTAKYHAWTFALATTAEVHAYTSRTPHQASVDTVLYLYKMGATGWGSYIARNDDDGTSEWSSIDKTLGLGQYRVLVKGYSSSTKGSFDVQLDCSGAGCALPCLFGSTLGDLDSNAAWQVDPQQRLFSSAGVSALDAQRIVLAMHESTHTDVMTVDEAFAAADQHEIDLQTITHVPTGRHFTIVDYGAGDNTYGAIFNDGTADLATAIHDSDFYRCAAY
ncbi:MAG TPA: hypothetical protein VLT45_11090 [Kofleriaceae bacterium]|nr:hypothetical protein [Kofleriaceae bacterium]